MILRKDDTFISSTIDFATVMYKIRREDSLFTQNDNKLRCHEIYDIEICCAKTSRQNQLSERCYKAGYPTRGTHAVHRQIVILTK